MSNPFTKQEIQERFDSLPQDMQRVVAGEEMAQRLETIGRKHELRIDGIGVLIEYSGLIMLGLIKTKEFVGHLQEKLNLSREQAEAIALEVDEQVFSRIRESLRKIQYQSTDNSRFSERDIPMPSTNIADEAPVSDQSTSAPSDTVSQEAAGEMHAQSPSGSPLTDTSAGDSLQNEINEMLAQHMSSSDFIPPSSQEEPGASAQENLSATAPAKEAATQLNEGIDSVSAPEKEFTVEPGESAQSLGQQEEEVGVAFNTDSAEKEIPRVAPTGLEQGVGGGNPEGVNMEGSVSVGADFDPANPYGGPTFGPDTAQADGIPPRASQTAPADQGTPAFEADREHVKDFQTKLQEKMATQDTAKYDDDPYRESIT